MTKRWGMLLGLFFGLSLSAQAYEIDGLYIARLDMFRVAGAFQITARQDGLYDLAWMSSDQTTETGTGTLDRNVMTMTWSNHPGHVWTWEFYRTGMGSLVTQYGDYFQTEKYEIPVIEDGASHSRR